MFSRHIKDLASYTMAGPTFITAEEEYKKDSRLKEEDIEKLRVWLTTQPDLPQNISDERLLMYIHCSNFDLNKAKEVCERDWLLRMKHPDLLAELDPCTPEQDNIWKLGEFWIAPETTKEGYRVCYAGLHDPNPSKYNFLEAMKAAIMVMWADYVSRGICPGFIFVLNAKGTSFGHALKASISTIRAFLSYAQEGNPINMKAVHIINVSYVVDKLMILTRPLIGKELYNIIKLHSGDMQSFFDVVPKNVLPAELGGTAGSSEELRSKYYII
uniref:CRAL-TRIO domain-containing protein n=2 Tax=Clastoptera arizonana TaxID=38151 RepID=A0A1B6DYS1_9HEMI